MPIIVPGKKKPGKRGEMAGETLWADYAYQGVDLTGYAGVVRYLRNGSKRQDLTVDEVKALRARGLQLAAFWQDGASSARLGYDRGVSDAQRADTEADALGAPAWWPIHFAVDDGTLTGPQVEPYFLGLLDTLRRPVGGYGGFAVVEHLSTLGIRWLIQASSWSAGRISSAAWLLQRDHNVPSGTSRVDVDVQLAPFSNAWRPTVAGSMSPDQRKAALLAEGLKIVEVRQWWKNDRGPVTGLPSSPKNGLVNHHTGGETSDPLKYASTILYDGRSDLPGPLCHDGLDPYTGTVYMVGTGRTNHAGKGASDVLNMVVNDTIPYDREVRSSLNDTDGNSRFYGLEVMYDGTHPLPDVGYVAMVKWNAALCRVHGWGGNSAIGHREWTNTKPDPGNVDLAKLRRDVRDCLALPAGVWPGATQAPPPPAPEEPRKEYSMRLVRNNTQGSTFDKGFGAIYLTGPAVWQHVPTVEQYNALKLAWGDYVDMGDGDLANLRDAYWATVQALKVGLDPDHYSAPPVAADSVPEADAEASADLPECADPSDSTNA